MFFVIWSTVKAVVDVFTWSLRKRLRERLNKFVTWV